MPAPPRSGPIGLPSCPLLGPAWPPPVPVTLILGRGGYALFHPPLQARAVRASGPAGQPWAEVRLPAVASRAQTRASAHSHIQGPTQLGHPEACLLRI